MKGKKMEKMEKMTRVFGCLADTFITPGDPTAGKILEALKEDPGYKKDLEGISQKDLFEETSNEEAHKIAQAIKEAVENYYNALLEELLPADEEE